MKRGKKQSPAAIVAQQLLILYPDTPTLTLAKKAYSMHPEMWSDLEAARSMLRFYRGASGEQSRKNTISKRDFSTDLFNPFQLNSPPSKRQVHFTCGPSRTEPEHPKPRFGQINFTDHRQY